jgi:hypothetical protein
VAGGEGFRARSDEVDVGAFVEDEAGGLDGVAEAFDAGYAAGAEGGSVHEEGVELDAAFGGEEAAAAGVEGGVVFEDGDGGFDGVGGGASPIRGWRSRWRGRGLLRLVVFGHFRGMAQAPPWTMRVEGETQVSDARPGAPLSVDFGTAIQVFLIGEDEQIRFDQAFCQAVDGLGEFGADGANADPEKRRGFCLGVLLEDDAADQLAVDGGSF